MCWFPVDSGGKAAIDPLYSKYVDLDTIIKPTKKSNFTGVLERDKSFKWGTFHQDLSYHRNEMTPYSILHKTE